MVNENSTAPSDTNLQLASVQDLEYVAIPVIREMAFLSSVQDASESESLRS